MTLQLTINDETGDFVDQSYVLGKLRCIASLVINDQFLSDKLY